MPTPNQYNKALDQFNELSSAVDRLKELLQEMQEAEQSIQEATDDSAEINGWLADSVLPLEAYDSEEQKALEAAKNNGDTGMVQLIEQEVRKLLQGALQEYQETIECSSLTLSQARTEYYELMNYLSSPIGQINQLTKQEETTEGVYAPVFIASAVDGAA